MAARELVFPPMEPGVFGGRSPEEIRWQRRAAVLWFIASAASLAAAVMTYSESGEVKWLLVAAGGLMAGVGFSSLRRSGSVSGRGDG